MMKNSNNKFILLLMVLYLIISSVDPVNGAVVAAIAATTAVAQAVTSGISLLTGVVNKVQVLDKETSTEMDRIITQIEEVQGLRFDTGELVHEVLRNLYRTQDRTITIRKVLVELATDLKSGCEGLISIYNKNVNTTHKVELLKFSVSRFVKLARDAKVTLSDASNLLKKAQDVLADTKAALTVYHGKIKDIRDILQKEILKICATAETCSDHTRKKRWIWIPIAIIAGIEINNKIEADAAAEAAEVEAAKQRLLRSYRNYYNRIDNLQGDVFSLLRLSQQLGTYVREELILIIDWESKLQATIRDHEEEITEFHIEFAIDEIKINLKGLVDACDRYLAHKLPNGITATKRSGLPFSMDGRPAIIGITDSAQTSNHQDLTRTSSDATGASTNGGVVGAVIDGVSLLKYVVQNVNPIQGMDNTTFETLHELTRQLEEAHSIAYNTSHLKQEVLKNLYRTQDKNTNIIQVFKSLTADIKSGSEGIIRIYEKFPDNNSPELFNYSITRFEKLARDSIETLKNAFTLLTDVEDVYMATRSASIIYNDKIKEIKNEMEKILRKNNSKKTQFECEGDCIAHIPTIFGQYVETVLNYGLGIGIHGESRYGFNHQDQLLLTNKAPNSVTSLVTTTGSIDTNKQLISTNTSHNSVASLVNTIYNLIDTNKQSILTNKTHIDVASIGKTISSLIDANKQLILKNNTHESVDTLQNTISSLIHTFEQLILTNKIINNVVSLRNTIQSLIDANEELMINNFGELQSLDAWKIKLQASLKDVLTPADIKDGIVEIKAHLRQLIKASNN